MNVAELVAATGDHPLAGAWCPGRHRASWTVRRVRADAMAGLRQSADLRPRGVHRADRPRLLNVAELLAADQLVSDLWAATYAGDGVVFTVVGVGQAVDAVKIGQDSSF